MIVGLSPSDGGSDFLQFASCHQMCLCVCSFWNRTKSTSGDSWLTSVTFCLMATRHRLLQLSKNIAHIMSCSAVIQAVLVVCMTHIERKVLQYMWTSTCISPRLRELKCWLFCRKNPTLSERLAGVTKHFEEDRERFLMPLCE